MVFYTPMTTNQAENKSELKAYFIARVRETRRYGQTYVHAGKRLGRVTIDGIDFIITGWGRSLQTARGHKYKVYAQREGKPVPSKEL